MTTGHEALLYADDEEYATLVGGRISTALDEGRPVLCSVTDERAELLADQLGDAWDRIEHCDVRPMAANPARIIPTTTSFLHRHPGQRCTVVGQTVWPGRTDAEVAEVMRHEALVNPMFEGSSHELLCAYDGLTLARTLLDDVARTHPVLSGVDGTESSADFTDPHEMWALSPAPGAPPAGAMVLGFGAGSLGQLRHAVAAHAGALGHSVEAVQRVVQVANEIASNAIAHGGGHGTVAVWSDDAGLTCEVRDAGVIADPLAGRYLPSEGHGRGLWLVNQLCRLVQLHSGSQGTLVRATFDD